MSLKCDVVFIEEMDSNIKTIFKQKSAVKAEQNNNFQFSEKIQNHACAS